jgi:catechol 2,3-dioxygenase-like lactoylglutathione lyase family enzyme
VGVLGDAELVAFVGSLDLSASETFYRHVLDLELLESTSFANVFAAGGNTLRVTRVEELEPAPYTVLGWNVPDVAAAVESLGARGAVFKRYDGMEQDEAGIWTAPGGARVAWFEDPDGNTLSLSQLPRG